MRSVTICFTIAFLMISVSQLSMIGNGADDASIESGKDTNLQKFQTSYSSENNSSLGWFAQAVGPYEDFITDSVSFQNGTTAVVGSFQSYIDFSFNFAGPQSTNGPMDVDFFIAWLDENGTWLANIGGGGQGFDKLNSIEKLSSGDIIVSGTYCYNTVGDECSMTLEGLDPLNKLEADDDGNAFLARMSSDGVWQWITQIESQREVYEFSLVVTPQDEIHLGAIFTGMVEFNSQTIPGGDQPNLLIAIYDDQGQAIGSLSSTSPPGVGLVGELCADDVGNTYAVLTYTEEIMFDQIVLNGTGFADIAIARYDATGWAWAQSAGGSDEDMAWDCDGTDSGVIVVGEFQGNASFGDFSTESSQWVDGFIASLSSEGEWQSLQKISGIGSDKINSVLVNQYDEITIAGITSGGLTFGQDTLLDLDDSTDVYHFDVFVAHADANLSWQWAINAGGMGNEEVNSLKTGPNGSPILTIQLNEDGLFGGYQADQQNSMDIGVWFYETDLDGDGVVDGSDNCPRDSNPLQENYDQDNVGDLCDIDDDNDGVPDVADDCPYGTTQWQSNPSTDHDGDGCQDSSEDYDDDGDGVFDSNDLCPLGPIGWVSSPEVDVEGDGCADMDTDEDGFVDQSDNCPMTYNPLQTDLDDDQLGDVCDDDEDGDGIQIPQDLCPHDTTFWTSSLLNDHDSDGCQDSVNDYNDDADAILDINDDCPIGHINWGDNASNFDHDGDGCHDQLEDDDDDNDGFVDENDNCPNGIIGISQVGQDEDMDGCIDSVEDEDDDGDGVADLVDQCPRTPKLTMVSGSGCSQYQLDDDLDGVVNAEDICLNSKPGIAVDEQGCEKLISEQKLPQSKDDESLFNLTNFFFLLAILMGIIAVYISNTKPKMHKAAIVPPVNPMGAPESLGEVKTLEAASLQTLQSAEKVAAGSEVVNDEPEAVIVDEPEAECDEVDYSSMTVAQLKDLLRESGKTVSGNKAELIERLQE